MARDVEAYAESIADKRITPTARRIAQQRALDVRGLRGTGPHGKIVKDDVIAARMPAAIPDLPGKVVPLTPMRRIIAERMTESYLTAPHYFVTIEVDMSAAVAFRAGCAFKPSYNDLVLMAVARALKQHPRVNTRWLEDSVIELEEIHLGVAVALDEGLVVPVLRNVDTLGLQEIHDGCAKLVEKARGHKLTPDDFAGSTFTVSNLGPFGVDQFTAIINQPNPWPRGVWRRSGLNGKRRSSRKMGTVTIYWLCIHATQRNMSFNEWWLSPFFPNERCKETLNCHRVM
jgi:pyruvate dehydrogenase E2 component (dihydrolipoamide acetyltransferase)